jgi:hypothetical protein
MSREESMSRMEAITKRLFFRKYCYRCDTNDLYVKQQNLDWFAAKFWEEEMEDLTVDIDLIHDDYTRLFDKKAIDIVKTSIKTSGKYRRLEVVRDHNQDGHYKLLADNNHFLTLMAHRDLGVKVINVRVLPGKLINGIFTE